jgi:hypothetical protein
MAQGVRNIVRQRRGSAPAADISKVLFHFLGLLERHELLGYVLALLCAQDGFCTRDCSVAGSVTSGADSAANERS